MRLISGLYCGKSKRGVKIAMYLMYKTGNPGNTNTCAVGVFVFIPDLLRWEEKEAFQSGELREMEGKDGE